MKDARSLCCFLAFVKQMLNFTLPLMCYNLKISSQLPVTLWQKNSLNFHDKSWSPVSTLNLNVRGTRARGWQTVCMSVQQASAPKVSVAPLNLEDAKEPPLNLYKPKEPYTATIVSVERLVGPKAPGETCHIVIDHGGNVPYWEGQSYGVIPPVSNL